MFQPFLSWLGFPPLACANWFAVCVMLVFGIVQYVDHQKSSIPHQTREFQNLVGSGFSTLCHGLLKGSLCYLAETPIFQRCM